TKKESRRKEDAMEQTTNIRSWVEVSPESHFPIQNLPYGVFYRASDPTKKATIGVAIGDFILDLAQVTAEGLFDGPLLKGSTVFNEVSFYSIYLFIYFFICFN